MTGPDIINDLVTGQNWPTHDEARSTAPVWARLTADGHLERMPKPPHITNPREEDYIGYAAAHGYKRVTYSRTLSAVHTSRWVENEDGITEQAEPMTLDAARAMCAAVIYTFVPHVSEQSARVTAEVAGESISALYVCSRGVYVTCDDTHRLPIYNASGAIITEPTPAQMAAINAALYEHARTLYDEGMAAANAVLKCTSIDACNTAMVTYCRKAPLKYLKQTFIYG